MNQDIYNLDDSKELGYREIFATFWRRRTYFLGIGSSVLLLTIPLVLSQKAVYESSMQLLIEPNYQSKSDDNEFDPTQSNTAIDYATQVNLMRSSHLLSRAVEILKPSYPEITTEEIKDNLIVSQVKEKEDKREVGTKIFQANYKTGNAKKTQAVLEALQEVYLEYNLEQQNKRFKEGLSFINKQIPEVRKKLTSSERNLETLLTQYNLISPSKEALNMSQLLTDIQQKREDLQAQYRQTQGKYNALQQDLKNLGKGNSLDLKLSVSTEYQTVLGELRELETELEVQRSRFTESNPVIQDLVTKRDNKKQKLEQVAKKVLGTNDPNLTNFEQLKSRGQLELSDIEVAEALAQTKNELAGLEAREKSLAVTEQQIKQRLNQFPSLIAQYDSLEQEVAVNQATLKKLLEHRQEIGILINRGGFSWEVIEPPQIGTQISPNLGKDLILCVILSGFAGAVSIFIIDASDNKIRVSKQLQDRANLPLLGTTPGLSKIKEAGLAIGLPFLSSDHQENLPLEIIEWLPFRESLDLVYENIQLINHSDRNAQIDSVAITSAIAGEGKSTITLGLALSAARRQQKVLVIDGDLRCPSIHEKLNIPNYLGLSDYLANHVALPNIVPVSLANSTINVLTSGSAVGDPVQLLSSDKLRQLIESLKTTYDLVLVDTSPVIGMVDAIKIASCCSGTVVVTRLEKVSFSEVTETYSLLSRLNLLGIIANDSKEVQKRYVKNQRYLSSVKS